MRWSDTPQGKVASEALSLCDRERYSEALELLEEARSIDSRDYIVLTHYGRVLHVLGRHGDARHAFRDALALNEDYFFAWSNYGNLLRDQEEYEKAAFCYERAAGVTPGASIYTVLASVQIVFEPESAVRNAERALAIDSQWSEARKILKAARNEMVRRGDA